MVNKHCLASYLEITYNKDKKNVLDDIIGRVGEELINYIYGKNWIR